MHHSDRLFLELCLQEAAHALQEGNFPVGSVIINKNGDIVAKGHNSVYTTNDLTAHGEINAIRSVQNFVHTNETYTLYTSLEPCLMCIGAICFAPISRVVWAAHDPRYGACEKIKYNIPFQSIVANIIMEGELFDDLVDAQQHLLQLWSDLHSR